MQVEDERKQGEQYKDQVDLLNAPILKHKSLYFLDCSQKRKFVHICELVDIWSPVHRYGLSKEYSLYIYSVR